MSEDVEIELACAADVVMKKPKGFLLITDRKPRYKGDRTQIGPFKTKIQALDYQYHLPNYGSEWRIIEENEQHNKSEQ